MISGKVIKHIGWRVKLMALGGGTYYRWDSANEQFIDATPFQYMSMCSAFGMGILFPLAHSIQAYKKMNADDIPEEFEDEDAAQKKRAKEVATLIIEFGEILLVTCIFFLNVVSIIKIDAHKYLLNQLIKYNKILNEMISSGKLELERSQRRVIRGGEFLLYLTMGISIFLPVGITGAIMHPIEPTHVLLKEWFDLDFRPTVEYLPITIPMMLAVYGCGTTVSLMMMGICMYYLIATVTSEALIAEAIHGKVTGGRCRVSTQHFGVMEDSEIVNLFRTQQILNVLLNNFYKSVLISFHHVGCLATAACLICFAIRYDDILSEEGPLAYAIVFASIFSVIVMISAQSKMGGDVVDSSDAFKNAGLAITGRSLFFNKFSRSCQTFYIQVAYPFYTIHKETFLLFCEQTLDYVFELLCM